VNSATIGVGLPVPVALPWRFSYYEDYGFLAREYLHTMKRVRSILSCIQDPVCLVRESTGEIIFSNEGRTGTIAETFGETMLSRLQRAFAGRNDGTVLRFTLQDPALPAGGAPMKVRATRIVLNGEPAFLLVCRRESSPQEDSHYRQLFDTSRVLFFVSSIDGEIREINASGARVLGYDTPEDLKGKSFVDLRADPEERTYFRERIESEGAVHDYEVVLRRRDGELVHCSESATLYRDPASGETLILGTIADITDRIRSEQTILKRTIDLADTNRKLTDAQNELAEKQKLASIGRLSAGIAHEINNPLGFVRSNIKSLRRTLTRMQQFFTDYDAAIATAGTGAVTGDAAGTDGSARTPDEIVALVSELRKGHKIDRALEDIDELFDETSAGLDRIQSIVSHLKDFSRAGANEDVGDYDLPAGVDAALALAAAEFAEYATVEREYSPVPPIECNANQINQVLLNVILNAADAIRRAEGRDGVIRIVVAPEGTDRVSCRISDNGTGMPGNVKARAFEPFFTTKNAGEGSGLGLSTAYDTVVNGHGGNMEIESTTGTDAAAAGTTVSITLPVTFRGGSSDGG